MTIVPRIALIAAALMAASSGSAHGLLLQVDGSGSTITGTVRYSDGTRGIGEYVRLVDLSRPEAAVRSATTDGSGLFRFAAERGRRYRLVAEGEEGHSTVVELTLGPGQRAAFIDGEGESSPFAPWLPVLGLVFLAAAPLPFVPRRVRVGEA